MNQILLVEDESNVRKPLVDYLTKEGFHVVEAINLKEADSKMANGPDLVLLDWMLPDGQGIELLKKWRKKGIQTATILLTARADLIDKVLGLELGANDYITKPFEPRELVARIRVQLRQKDLIGSDEKVQKDHLIEQSEFVMDTIAHEVFFSRNRLELTKTEFGLLKLFLENPNQVFSREELLKSVWGYDQYPTTRTVDTHVLQLRQKTKAELFETVHGIGYRFRPRAK